MGTKLLGKPSRESNKGPDQKMKPVVRSRLSKSIQKSQAKFPEHSHRGAMGNDSGQQIERALQGADLC